MKVSQIRMDGGTQPRAQLMESVVLEYAEAMAAGAPFPPVVVFYDGTDHWLADGFHRVRAALYLGNAKIDAEVRQGTRRDAVLHSVGANAEHGLRRTNEDKRRAVELLLDDPEWSKWSSNRIAMQCGVGHKMVDQMRAHLEQSARCEAPTTRTVERNGTTYQQDTTNIGKRPPAPAPAPADDAPAADAVETEREYPPVTIKPGEPQRASLKLIETWHPFDVAKFAGVLFYELQVRGMIQTYAEVKAEIEQERRAQATA